jgi:hypothetical protein
MNQTFLKAVLDLRRVVNDYCVNAVITDRPTAAMCHALDRLEASLRAQGINFGEEQHG